MHTDGFDPGNYLETANPFHLAKPPLSFLRDLFTYDSKLVIFPSRVESVYRLCRRASLQRFWMSFDKTHGDAQTCIDNRIIPLKAILPQPQWGQTLISQLAACDVQRVGGGVAADELLNEQEELAERLQQAEQDDRCVQMAGEAYRGIKAQLGSTTRSPYRREGAGATKNPLTQRTARPRRTYRPRGSGDHAIFVGR